MTLAVVGKGGIGGGLRPLSLLTIFEITAGGLGKRGLFWASPYASIETRMEERACILSCICFLNLGGKEGGELGMYEVCSNRKNWKACRNLLEEDVFKPHPSQIECEE